MSSNSSAASGFTNHQSVGPADPGWGEGRWAPASATALLQLSLDVLEREAPRHAAMLRDVVCTLDVALFTVNESMRLTVVDRALHVENTYVDSPLRATTTLRLVVALLDDELSIREALRTRQLHIVGPLPQLRRASRALRIFLHGLVRAPAGANLLRALRQLAKREE